MDFSGQNLRGRNFRGQDLTGANFSHADIRGANFSNAILKGANFTGAKAGLQKRWLIFQLIVLFLLNIIFNFVTAVLNGIAIEIFFAPDCIQQSNTIFIGTATITALITVFYAIASQGLTTKALGIISVATAVVGNFSAAGAGSAVVTFVIAVAIAIAGTISVAVTVILTGFVAGVVISAVATAVGAAIVATAAGSVPTAGSTAAVAIAGSTAGSTAAVAIGGILLGLDVAWQSSKGDEKFALARTIGVAFGAIGGTSFCGADLTNADFTKTILKSTNFNHTKQNKTILHQVCWSGSKKLDRARLGTSILANPAVCELLITRNGYKKSYKNADLYNANLKGINLECADLEQANLSHAALQQANLKHANLTKALAIGANFSQAYLTGACLESWNIDHTTTLDRVDCQFVYLLEQPNAIGSRERRPHDSDKVFQPGDFEKLYTKVMTTVQLLLRNGVNPQAVAVAFQTLMQETPEITPDSVQAIEKKGSDVLVTLQLPEGTDKGKVERTFDNAYQAKLEAQKNAELLEAEKHHSQEFKEVTLALAKNFGNLLSNLTIVAGNENTMTDHKNQGISAGSGSFINTGEIQMTNSLLNMSGAVTNALNQLPETTIEQPGIKELLVQLQAEIESDPELSEKGKTNALEQVKTLAEVGQNPEQPEKKSLGEKAMIFLKGTIANLPDTAKLAEASSKLLPLIAKALGLPM